MFDDPRIIYDLTPHEISNHIKGKQGLLKRQNQAENIRAGTICACIYNQNRRKKNDRVWTWKDFFADMAPRKETNQDELRQKCIKFMKAVNSRGK